MENVRSETSLDIALQTEFERAAVAIIHGGGDLMHVTTFMKLSKINSENWVANSILAKFAFKHPLYLKKIKEQFHTEFDPDRSGELDRKELIRFIAFHVKIAFQNGQKPVTEFNDDDGSLEVSDIVRLLETRCQSYLQQYINLDDDQSGTYGWDEIKPVIKQFYSNMWNAQRKEDDGKNEWLSAEEEKELKAKFAAIIANVRTQDSVEHKTALDHRQDKAARSVKGKIKSVTKSKGQRDKKYVVHKQVRTSGPVAHDLPEGWNAHTDPKSGKQYYHNPKTGVTSWKKPKA